MNTGPFMSANPMGARTGPIVAGVRIAGKMIRLWKTIKNIS